MSKIYHGMLSCGTERYVFTYENEQSCLIGLCNEVLKRLGTDESWLDMPESLKFIERYMAGEYSAALLRFNSRSVHCFVDWHSDHIGVMSNVEKMSADYVRSVEDRVRHASRVKGESNGQR